MTIEAPSIAISTVVTVATVMVIGITIFVVRQRLQRTPKELAQTNVIGETSHEASDSSRSSCGERLNKSHDDTKSEVKSVHHSEIEDFDIESARGTRPSDEILIDTSDDDMSTMGYSVGDLSSHYDDTVVGSKSYANMMKNLAKIKEEDDDYSKSEVESARVNSVPQPSLDAILTESSGNMSFGKLVQNWIDDEEISRQSYPTN